MTFKNLLYLIMLTYWKPTDLRLPHPGLVNSKYTTCPTTFFSYANQPIHSHNPYTSFIWLSHNKPVFPLKQPGVRYQNSSDHPYSWSLPELLKVDNPIWCKLPCYPFLKKATRNTFVHVLTPFSLLTGTVALQCAQMWYSVPLLLGTISNEKFLQTH